MEHAGTDGRTERLGLQQASGNPFQQTWESNRSVRLENVGTTDLVNPWLSNGRSDFRSIQEIVARAVKPGMSDQDKAMALWWQEIQYRYHYEGDNNELSSPVKVFNVYGHNTCGNDSICLAGQWKLAGLKVAPARLVGHCVSQVFYDGGWHLFDGDMDSIYLLRDNETIAGEQDLVRDHDLVKRTHTQGILQPDRRAGDEWESSIYVFEGEVAGDRNADGSTSMNMILRPGEAIVWRWGHVTPVKYHGGGPPRFPDRLCNGLWEFRPDFAMPTWRQGAAAAEGIKAEADGLAAADGQGGNDFHLDDEQPVRLRGRETCCRRERCEICHLVGRQVMGRRRPRSRRQVFCSRNGALCLSTAVPAFRRCPPEETRHHQRRADGSAHPAQE